MENFSAIIVALMSGFGYCIKLLINMRKEILHNTNDIEVLKRDNDELKSKTNEIDDELKRVNENMIVINELKVSIKYIEESISRILNKMDDNNKMGG